MLEDLPVLGSSRRAPECSRFVTLKLFHPKPIGLQALSRRLSDLFGVQAVVAQNDEVQITYAGRYRGLAAIERCAAAHGVLGVVTDPARIVLAATTRGGGDPEKLVKGLMAYPGVQRVFYRVGEVEMYMPLDSFVFEEVAKVGKQAQFTLKPHSPEILSFTLSGEEKCVTSFVNESKMLPGVLRSSFTAGDGKATWVVVRQRVRKETLEKLAERCGVGIRFVERE